MNVSIKFTKLYTLTVDKHSDAQVLPQAAVPSGGPTSPQVEKSPLRITQSTKLNRTTFPPMPLNLPTSRERRKYFDVKEELFCLC